MRLRIKEAAVKRTNNVEGGPEPSWLPGTWYSLDYYLRGKTGSDARKSSRNHSGDEPRPIPRKSASQHSLFRAPARQALRQADIGTLFWIPTLEAQDFLMQNECIPLLVFACLGKQNIARKVQVDWVSLKTPWEFDEYLWLDDSNLGSIWGIGKKFHEKILGIIQNTVSNINK